MLTPSILDRYKEDGIFFGVSTTRSGDMSLRANGFDQARKIRQAFFDEIANKFSISKESISVDRAIFMLPDGKPPVVAQDNGSRQIITGPEAVITQEKATIVMQPQDCPPIYLYDPSTKALGFIHGGYKAVDDQIVIKTVSAMQETFGTHPEDLIAVVGPGIGPGWFRRRYLITKNPSLWKDAISTWDNHDEVAEQKIKMDSEPATIFFPKNNYLLNKALKDWTFLQKISLHSTDIIEHVLTRMKTQLPQLAINLQKPIVGQLMFAGLRHQNVEVDTADTFQNAQRGLLFSHQAQYRGVAKQHGNPIAVFGKIA